MSVKAITWAFDCKTGSPTTKMVLVKLADNANDDGYCWPSLAYLAHHCEMNRATVIRHIQKLAELGLVTIIPQRHQGVSMPNHYQLHLGGVVAGCDGGGSRTARPLVADGDGGVVAHSGGVVAQRDPYYNRHITVSKKPSEDSASGISNEIPTAVPVSAKPKTVPIDTIVDLYHQILPFGSACKKITAKRKAAIVARWRSGDLPDVETWREYFERAAKSKFIRGEVPPSPGHRQFQVSLDYLIREDSYAKALENTGAFKW